MARLTARSSSHTVSATDHEDDDDDDDDDDDAAVMSTMMTKNGRHLGDGPTTSFCEIRYHLCYYGLRFSAARKILSRLAEFGSFRGNCLHIVKTKCGIVPRNVMPKT